jgi:predicted metal-binding membrane protein
MSDMRAMPRPAATEFAVLAVMWWAMMIAMMVPSAAPAVLLYGQVHRARTDLADRPPTAAFLAGYLICWLVFALVAAGAQVLLQEASIASPMTMALHGGTAAAALLIAAGAYQLSPLKDACLGKCRAPASFLAEHYRSGRSGAFRMGLLHGAYCVGCCWLLMALLFVGGVMNIAWIAGLTLVVAAEKLLPGGQWIARLIGVAMIAGGTIALF